MRRRIALLALVVTAVATACGGGDDGEGRTDATTTTARARRDVAVPCRADAPPVPQRGPRGPIPVERFQTKADSKLTVAAHADRAPFAHVRGGKLAGFEVDLVTAMGERMELIVDIQRVGTSDGLVPGVVAGTFDTAVSGVVVPAQPIPEVLFTDPVLDKGQAYVVRRDREPTSTSGTGTGTAPPAVAVGVVDGTPGAAFVPASCAGVQARPFPSVDDALAALAAGDQLDGVVAAFPDVAMLVRRAHADRLEVAATFPSGERVAFPVAEVTPGLLGGLNTALDEVREDGTYDEIYRRWFGVPPP